MESAALCNSAEEDTVPYKDMMMMTMDVSVLPTDQELDALMHLDLVSGENDMGQVAFYDNFDEEAVDLLLKDMQLPIDNGNMDFYEPEMTEAQLVVEQENARDQLYKDQPEDGIFPSLRSQVAKISEIVDGVIAGGDYDRAYDILVKLQIVESEAQRELRKFADSLNRFKCVIKMHNANRELFVHHMKLQQQQQQDSDDAEDAEAEMTFDNEVVKSVYDKISARIKAIDGQTDDDDDDDHSDTDPAAGVTLEKASTITATTLKEEGDGARQPSDGKAPASGTNAMIDSNILLLPGPSGKSGKSLTDIIAPKSASRMDPPTRGRRNSARNKRGVNNNSQLISPAADASVLGATPTSADQKRGSDQKRAQTRRTSSRGSVLDGRVYSLASLTVETSMNLFTGAKYREPRVERIVAHAYYFKETKNYKLYLVDNNISPVDHKRVVELKASQVKSIRWDLPKDLRETQRADHDMHRVPRTPLTAYELAMSREDVIKNVRDIRRTERQFILTANPFATATPAARPQNHPTRFHHHAKHADLVEMEIICPNGDLEDVMRLILSSPYARSIFTQKRVNITADNIKRFVKKVNMLVFYTTADCALDIRYYLEERDIKVKDSMYERQGLGIFFQKTDELCRRAEFFVNVGRKEGLTDVQMVFAVNMPLRAYVIFLLCELGSKTYTPAYMVANEKLLSYKGVELSEAQTEQLLDAFYWTHLAPPGQRINFSMIISFYDSVGRTVRLKSPHMVHGQSVGRTSASGGVRNFKNVTRMINVNNPSSHITIAPDGKTIVACSAVGKRKPNENPSVKDVLNIQRVTRARYERKKSLNKRQTPAGETPDESDAGDQDNGAIAAAAAAASSSSSSASRTRKMRASSISAMPKEYDSIISCIPDTPTISPKETCDPNIPVKTEPAAEPTPGPSPDAKVPKRRGRKPGSTNKPKATGSRTTTEKRRRGRKCSSMPPPPSPGPQGAQRAPVTQAEMDDTLESVAHIFQEVKVESMSESKADNAPAPDDIMDVLEPTVAMETSIFDSSKLLTQPDKASILPQIANIAALASMVQSTTNATSAANTPCTFVINEFTPLGTMTNVTQQPMERTLTSTSTGAPGIYPRGVMPVDNTHIQFDNAPADPQEALLSMPIPPSTESIFPDGNVRPIAQLARAVFVNPSRFTYDERKMSKKCEKRRKSAQQAVVALTPSDTRSAASGRVRTLTGLVQYNAVEPQVDAVHQDVPLALDVTAADLEMGDPLLQATFLHDNNNNNNIQDDMDSQMIPDV